jgi:hypothetical protein
LNSNLHIQLRWFFSLPHHQKTLTWKK